jgi:hypothetical protein
MPTSRFGTSRPGTSRRPLSWSFELARARDQAALEPLPTGWRMMVRSRSGAARRGSPR